MCVDVVLQILGTTHYLNPVSVSVFNVYQTKLLTEKRGNLYVTCKDNKDHSHTPRTMATCFSLQFYLDRIVMVIKYLRLRLYSYTLPFHFNSKWNNLPIKKHIHTHIDEREWTFHRREHEEHPREVNETETKRKFKVHDVNLIGYAVASIPYDCVRKKELFLVCCFIFSARTRYLFFCTWWQCKWNEYMKWNSGRCIYFAAFLCIFYVPSSNCLMEKVV